MSSAREPDILFLACTKPAMKMGVPFEGYMGNLCITLVLGMILGSPLYWSIGIATHLLMRILTEIDHNFFRIIALWAQTKGTSIHTDRWGGSMLSPLDHGMPSKAKEMSVSV